MAAEICGVPPKKQLFLNYRVIESTSVEQAIEDLSDCNACFVESHDLSDKVVPMPENLKYYTLFEMDEINQIGIIQCAKYEDLKLLIEKACKAHFGEACTIAQKQIDNNKSKLEKFESATMEITTESGNTPDIEIQATCLYSTNDL